jgi:hypothetical protein
MLLTIFLFVIGTGLTLWGVRVWYVGHRHLPHNLHPSNIRRPGLRRKWWGALLVVGGGLTLCACGLLWFSNYHNEHWVTCRIDHVEELGGDNYRIQSSDCGTLDNTNTLWRMKFNAASLQGWLKKDSTVELRVAGASLPDWDWHPNLIATK